MEYYVCFYLWSYGYMRVPFSTLALALTFKAELEDDPAIMMVSMEYAR